MYCTKYTKTFLHRRSQTEVYRVPRACSKNCTNPFKNPVPACYFRTLVPTWVMTHFKPLRLRTPMKQITLHIKIKFFLLTYLLTSYYLLMYAYSWTHWFILIYLLTYLFIQLSLMAATRGLLKVVFDQIKDGGYQIWRKKASKAASNCCIGPRVPVIHHRLWKTKKRTW